jgi:hypothetical protein
MKTAASPLTSQEESLYPPSVDKSYLVAALSGQNPLH